MPRPEIRLESQDLPGYNENPCDELEGFGADRRKPVRDRSTKRRKGNEKSPRTFSTTGLVTREKIGGHGREGKPWPRGAPCGALRVNALVESLSFLLSIFKLPPLMWQVPACRPALVPLMPAGRLRLNRVGTRFRRLQDLALDFRPVTLDTPVLESGITQTFEPLVPHFEGTFADIEGVKFAVREMFDFADIGRGGSIGARGMTVVEVGASADDTDSCDVLMGEFVHADERP